jgi:hypothetical protein
MPRLPDPAAIRNEIDAMKSRISELKALLPNESPIQDAVVAFCVLVRAIADGNRTREKEQLDALKRGGFDVRVRRDSVVRRQAAPAR